MKFINSWKSHVLQSDKIKLEVRISKVTLLSLDVDISNKHCRFVLFNLGLEI